MPWPTFYDMACEIEHKANGGLSEKERAFVADMVRWCARREPSEKQAKWLHCYLLPDRTRTMLKRPEKPQTFNGDLANLPAALAPLCQQRALGRVVMGMRASKNGLASGPSRRARRVIRAAMREVE